MLRCVYLENFVKFKHKQIIKFEEDESPYIFVGENGSGKSSLLEGIRRCLSQKTSTTKSSVFDKSKPGFCICKYDTSKCSEAALNVCEIMFTGVVREQTESSDIIYKFASTKTELLINRYIGKICYEIQTQSEENTKNFFDRLNKLENESLIHLGSFKYTKTEESALENRLSVLEDHVILTFPLRSIGPLQWSKSDRIKPEKREENYKEAGKRAEIIDYYLSKCNKEKFDEHVEQEIFCDLTGQTGIQFSRGKDGRIQVHSTNQTLLAEQEYALLKIPEGILEAKYFSILMSNRKFLTIVLEEPDRGMHPQMVERMLAIIQKESNKKMVILTTHNTTFVNSLTITRLVIFRWIKDHTETISGTQIAKRHDSSSEMPSMKTLRILTRDHLADLIFAKRILFCEGESDYLFISALKEKVMKRANCIKDVTDKILKDDHIKQKLDTLQRVCVSLQIINMDGWGNAKRMHTLCSDDCLKLDDHYFVCDKDAILTGDYKAVEPANEWIAPRAREREDGFTNIMELYKSVRKENEDAAWEKVREYLRDHCKCFSWRDGTIEDMIISLLRSETKIKKIEPKAAEGYDQELIRKQQQNAKDSLADQKIEPEAQERYDQELSWKQKQDAIDALADQKVDLPYDRWKKRRHQQEDKKKKLFLSPNITQENVAKSLEIILKACDSSTDDLVQFISFLLKMEKADHVA